MRITYFDFDGKFEFVYENQLKIIGSLNPDSTISIYAGKDYKKIIDLKVKQYNKNEIDFDYIINTDKSWSFSSNKL